MQSQPIKQEERSQFVTTNHHISTIPLSNLVNNNNNKMKLNTNLASLVALLAAATSLGVASALLVQPHNYMLDDSAMVNQADGGSLSPFYNDHNEHTSDKDIISIIGDGLARLRFARMLDRSPEESAQQQQGQLSQEMADLIQSEQQANQKEGQEQSLSASVANMLLNAAQAAVQDSSQANSDEAGQAEGAQSSGNHNGDMSSRGSIMELDTSNGGSSMPSKADLKSGPSQWFNPKESIPVLKISSMGKWRWRC